MPRRNPATWQPAGMAATNPQTALAWRLSRLAGLCPLCSYTQAIARASVTHRLRGIPLCPDCQGIDINAALERGEQEGNRGQGE
jgi:hypothetical protein